MSDTHAQPNTPEARTEDGTLKDQTKTPETTGNQETNTETEKETPGSTDTTKDKPEKQEDKSLLNQDEEKKATGAPEAYEPFKAPEGMELDKELVGKAQEMFKEMNLTQEQGQKLVDFFVAQQIEASDAPYKAYDEMRETWRSEVKADHEIGNKLPQVKVNIGKLYDTLGDAELVKGFKAAMDLTGAGDHPAFIKVMNKVALLVTEGTHVNGRGPSGAGQEGPDKKPATAAAAIYPNLPSSANRS